jgi:hypothetical protein
VALFIALLVALSPPDRSAVSIRFHLRIEVPLGWTLLRQTSYPSIIAVMTHRDGGRLTLSGQPVGAGATARTLVDQNRPLLEKQGLRIERLRSEADGVLAVEASTHDGKLAVRQLYSVRVNRGLVLTLAAASAKIPGLTKDFELAWHSIRDLEEEDRDASRSAERP